MADHRGKWWDRMLTIHGSEEAVRQFMRDNGNKSRRNSAGTGGFAKMSPEARKAAQDKGRETQRRNREKANQPVKEEV